MVLPHARAKPLAKGFEGLRLTLLQAEIHEFRKLVRGKQRKMPAAVRLLVSLGSQLKKYASDDWNNARTQGLRSSHRWLVLSLTHV